MNGSAVASWIVPVTVIVIVWEPAAALAWGMAARSESAPVSAFDVTVNEAA
jgi:hypothetical protein